MLFNLNLRMSIEKSRSVSTAHTLGGSSGGKNSGSAGFKSGLGGNANRMELGRAAVKVDEEVYGLGGIQVQRTGHLTADDKRNSAPFNNSGVSTFFSFHPALLPSLSPSPH